MSHIQTLFPSKYLKAADLGQARPVVTIAGVSMEEIGEEKLPVLLMIGKEKTLVLNRTNANMIAEIANTYETDEWRGVKVQLYATKTDFGGKRVDCIRIERPTVTKPLPPMPAPLPPTTHTGLPPAAVKATTTGWAQVAAPATSGQWVPPPLPVEDTIATGEPLADEDIPF